MEKSNPTSPAEELRAAATVVRGAAHNATPGPWTVSRLPGIGRTVNDPTARLSIAVGTGWVSGADGEWIALMSPAAAEPLAAWLDAEAMPPEDEQRVRELLDMHPALLQSEAIELRRHLLDAREDLAAVRAELAAAHEERAGIVKAAREVARQKDLYFEQRATARALAKKAERERDEAREQVQRVRDRHYGVCHGACGLDDACECEERDLVCAECNDRYPCPTIRTLDGTEADR